MKYFIIAGEASGDLHASNLIKQIRLQDPSAEFVGLGGDKMCAAGCALRQHYRAMAYMGVFAVLAHLPEIRHNFRITHESLLAYRPDILILVDYPSFNLKIAAYCRKHLPDTKIYYYIPPKVWAWKTWRVHKIARLCDKVLGIFPFEPAFYAKYGYACTYTGNPTNDTIREWCEEQNIVSGEEQRENIIAILPGSRRSEITHCLPTMLAAARRVNQRLGDSYQIVVTAAPGIEDSFYAGYLEGETLTRDTYSVVAHARAAVVNSGTATLETALLHCPQTAVYYIACSRWLEWLFRPILFRIPHFTLVNILVDNGQWTMDNGQWTKEKGERREGQAIIEELIASRFTEENVENELYRLLTDEVYRRRMLDGYTRIRSILGSSPAALTAAKVITNK